MKKLNITLLPLFFLLAMQFAVAQNDTLLFQDFQLELIENVDYALFPEVPDTDNMWVNWDEDGVNDFNNRPKNWYGALEFYQATWNEIPASDTNFVVHSSSWLENFDPNNSNWLISPLIYISDDLATLHWKSAPRQGPRYMDGYAVKILTGNSDHTDPSATSTTVFRAAEMVDFVPGSPAGSLDPADYVMSSGYVHANNWTDTTYIILPEPGETSNGAILEPHSVSLADWAGQWVYIAFHHDSSDDNFMELDDILLLGTMEVSSTRSLENELRFVTFPNPVDNFLNVMFRLGEPATASLELFNQHGQLVALRNLPARAAGEFNEQFDLRRLPAGAYTVVLTVNGQPFAKNIIRR